MARFYGILNGDNRPEVTRLGHHNIHAAAQGWNVGVRVHEYKNDNGQDVFDIYLTSGSHGRYGSTRIGSFTEADIHTIVEK